MPRAYERRINPIGPSGGELVQGRLDLAARTTRAMGETNVVGSISNMTKTSNLARGLGHLSESLREVDRTVSEYNDRKLREEALKGQAQHAAGATAEEMKTRGMQEGWLEAEGIAQGEAIRRDLVTRAESGELTPGQADAEMRERLKGAGQQDATFLNALLPRAAEGVNAAEMLAARKQQKEFDAEAEKNVKMGLSGMYADPSDEAVFASRRTELFAAAKKMGKASEFNNWEMAAIVDLAIKDMDLSVLQLAKTKRADGTPSLADSVEGGWAELEKIESYIVNKERREESFQREKVREEDTAALQVHVWDASKGKSVDELEKMRLTIGENEEIKAGGWMRAAKAQNLLDSMISEKNGEVSKREEKANRRILSGAINGTLRFTESELQMMVGPGGITPSTYQHVRAIKAQGAEPVLKAAMMLVDNSLIIPKTAEEGAGNVPVEVFFKKDGKITSGLLEPAEIKAFQFNVEQKLLDAVDNGSHDFKGNRAAVQKEFDSIVTEELDRLGVQLRNPFDLKMDEVLPSHEKLKAFTTKDWEGANALTKDHVEQMVSAMKPIEFTAFANDVKDPRMQFLYWRFQREAREDMERKSYEEAAAIEAADPNSESYDVKYRPDFNPFVW